MGRVDGIVNGGDCEVGVESTVITVVTEVPRVLRPGGISVEQLRRVLGRVDVDRAVLEKPAENAKVASPGMKYKHYAPKADVYMGGCFRRRLRRVFAYAIPKRCTLL